VNDFIYYTPESDSIGWSDGGAITLTIPMSSLRSWYRQLRRTIGGDDAESLEGFFDFVKKAVRSVGKAVSSIAKSPIVRAVAGVIPYGATALSVVEIADKALSRAKGAIKKKPATHDLIRKAAAGPPAAKAAARKVLRSLPPNAKKAAARAAILQRHAFRLKADLEQARKALNAAGYTPGLQRALRIQRAPWSYAR
jgi:hypothetical protein